MKNLQLNFDDYYQSIYGARWASLKAALLQEEKKVRLYNSWAIQGENHSANTSIPWLPQCRWNETSEVIPRDSNNLLSYYILDPSSVLVASNLQVRPGEKVLDLCAAPGGKSLVLAQSLFRELSPSTELILNEFSSDRRERLKKVVQQYIPFPHRDQLWIRGKDGMRFGLETQNYFDAILLDAPCSGERHLLEKTQNVLDWRVNRTKGLAQKQYALLCSAWMALKPGGRLIYSTCSISPMENDSVIEKFIKKKKDVIVSTMSLRGDGVEETQYGLIYLPDRSGFGPMYSCSLLKPLV